jgi:succinate-acetate transporter protein
MAFFVGGLAQFVSGVCELATGNSFGMTVSCSYGGYWMSIGLLFW